MAKIVILAGKSQSTPIVYNWLSKKWDIERVIIEESVPKKTFLRNRAKKLGWIKVFGQMIFMATIPKLLLITSRNRIKAIFSQYGLNQNNIPEEKILKVNSVNSPHVRDILSSIQPDVIVVNGTRIISQKLLNSINRPFINMHSGITPMYRGVHGGYWSLVNNDVQNFGVTVHYVDKGVDTGEVIFQNRVVPEKSDNFITYPLLQLSIGLPALTKAVEMALSGNLTSSNPPQKFSKQWYHPTIWEYLYFRVLKGVK